MNEISIQQISLAKYKTSGEADALTKQFQDRLGLDTKAAVARLAIGRSLGVGAITDLNIDAKGLDIPSSVLFKADEIGLWISLILQHDRIYSKEITFSIDHFRLRVRQHWHRGIKLLNNDWTECNEKFDSFISILISRRSQASTNPYINPKNVVLTNVNSQIEDRSDELQKALAQLSIQADIKGVITGPRITRYKVYLRDANKLPKIQQQTDQLGLILNSQHNKPVVSAGNESKQVFVDIARDNSKWVFAGRSEFLDAIKNQKKEADKLILCPGQDTIGYNFEVDLIKAPHILVAGATGQGKSVCMHSFILSLYKNHDRDNVKFALIDPKQVEFSMYKDISNLWQNKIAIGANEAGDAIDSIVEEMDRRYTELNRMGQNNLIDARKAGLKCPFLVVCIDELADLLLQNNAVEDKIVRIAQLGRAAGIHLILATQRPDAQTITGLIRSNIPTRIALRVQKGTESKIILDDVGAENLLGQGDMLIKGVGNQLNRIHGYFLSNDDVKSILRSDYNDS